VGVVRLVWYVVVGVVALAVAAALILILHTAHQAPVQYVGSPSGFEGFVPSGQTVSYKGSQDPVGDLILSNGTVIHDAVWNGQYSNTIIQNHNQIVQLNNQLNGDMQDFYIIKGQVPIEQVTINGQTYYVIEANSINPANIAGFYTYQGWVPNFVAAINTPGTTAAGLPGNSPVFQWTNTTGTVAYQTMVYQDYIRGAAGGTVLVLPNGTIISYGASAPYGSALFNFTTPQHTYNPSS
jgi:hypothetical protein